MPDMGGKQAALRCLAGTLVCGVSSKESKARRAEDRAGSVGTPHGARPVAVGINGHGRRRSYSCPRKWKTSMGGVARTAHAGTCRHLMEAGAVV